MPNMNYWSNRRERSEHAVSHTMLMERKYKAEIQQSIDESLIYHPDTRYIHLRLTHYDTKFSLVNEGSVDAIMRLAKGDMAVLNFASFTHPGGKFLEGSSAQEESLCHESFLYNVLSEFPTYYNENATMRNNFMYQNRAIYSPGIKFIRDNHSVNCGVITCAAPNLSGNRKFHNRKVSQEENDQILMSRCRFILEIAESVGVDTLILGAFGCGVFGQNPETVATCFCDLLTDGFDGRFKEVVFAIPSIANPENYDAFDKVLRQYDLI